jgi:hypothetical protein
LKGLSPLSNGVPKLIEVSKTRRNYLRNWYNERIIDLALRKSDVGDADTSAVLPIKPASYTQLPKPNPGEIRLLGPGATTDEFRLEYVAVLEVERDNGYALIAPFSPYEAPACKDEWLTGLAAHPLKVLQLWNAQPVTCKDLFRSWKTAELTRDELADARTLYRCAVSGRWAPFPLRERTGLAIHDTDDIRMTYQTEELALLSPLRERFHALVAASESRAIPQEIPELEWKAADDGAVFAQVSILASDGSFKAALKAEMTSDETSALWRILTWPDAAPGTPVSAYAGKPSTYVEPLAVAFTAGDDGCELDFSKAADSSEDLCAALDAGTVWFIVREI